MCSSIRAYLYTLSSSWRAILSADSCMNICDYVLIMKFSIAHLSLHRRAQLRDCLEVLRQHVPLPDKLTTLALLQSAKKYIEVINSNMYVGRHAVLTTLCTCIMF